MPLLETFERLERDWRETGERQERDKRETGERLERDRRETEERQERDRKEKEERQERLERDGGKLEKDKSNYCKNNISDRGLLTTKNHHFQTKPKFFI